jgi:NADPH-dependent curcumin reductase CurA
VSDGKAVTVLPSLPVDEKVWLGPLGMTGMTAYFGLLVCCVTNPIMSYPLISIAI